MTLIDDWRNAWKFGSTRIMALAGFLAAVYFALPVEQQQEIIHHLPVPAWLLPIITSAVGIAWRMLAAAPREGKP